MTSLERVEWQETDDGLRPVIPSRPEVTIAWAPQPGSQEWFLTCPIRECLYEGTRGPGKTDALLMDFVRDVGRGLGADWRGVLFRRTYPELADVIQKARKWFPRIFPAARYNETDHSWRFPDGEILLFRPFERDADYDKYHGHAYPWIGWEELCNWPTDVPFTTLISTNRSANPAVRKRIRATANPYGVGHNWVKLRYRLPIPSGRIVGPIIKDAVDREGKPTHWRVVVHGSLSENKILLHADPNYEQTIGASAKNESQLRAWKNGDWNVVAGGMFDDVWDPARHIVPDFPFSEIPREWYVNRSYDHGQSKPFSVGWWAESNGEPFTWNGRVYGQRRGDLYRIAEWYGWNGRPNEGLNTTAGAIAKGIAEREIKWFGNRSRVKAGPADTQIFDASELREENEPVRSVASDMEKHKVKWGHADKGPGSRKQGWQQIRKALTAALNPQREEPGLFVLERCYDGFIRTIPVLPRDDKDLDDVDDEAEDHCLGPNTRVVTEDGLVAIHSLVGTEGRVLTQRGWRRYTNCRMTRRDQRTVLVSTDHGEFIATPDHRVLTDAGWINACNLDEMRYILLACNQNESVERVKSSRAPDIGYAAHTLRVAALGCIGAYGSRLMDQFRMASTYTTRMATGTITSFPTCASSGRQRTLSYTGKSQRGNRSVERISCVLGLGLGSGMQARRGSTGIASIFSRTSEIAFFAKNRCGVRSAIRPLMALPGDQSSARMCANQRGEEMPGLMMLKSSANGAALPSGEIATTRYDSARGRARVRRVEPSTPTDVYCLTVPSVGHFAIEDAGFIVANCGDEVRYRLRAPRAAPLEIRVVE